MVNQAVRAGLAAGVTSRASLARLAFASLSTQYKGLSSYVAQAIGDAVAILHAHRRRERRGTATQPPFVHRMHLKVAPASFHFDATTGNVRVSVGNGRWVSFQLAVSTWHREQLSSGVARPVLLTLKPGAVTIVTAGVPPKPYEPKAVLAFDTNEESLDGVMAAAERAKLVRVPLGNVRAVQARHSVRRRRLAAKKNHDRRLMRRLLGREGKRERDRVKARLHLVSKRVVGAAKTHRAAIALEDLTGIRRTYSPNLNLRLSAWPHRQLHHQIAYKAMAAGVPVVFVNPYLTSKKCAACGWTPKRSKTRKSARKANGMYVCGNPECGWTANRQFNAGINILRTALTDRPGLGGVRFHLDALSHDVMNPLCEPASRAVRDERMEREFKASVSRAGCALARTATGHVPP